MGGRAFFLIAFAGFIVVYGQTTIPTICWDTKWFNSSAPTKLNRSEYEQQSANVLDSVCANGPITAARCKDSKGESFTGFRNDSVIKYIAKCDITNGLICNPYNTSKDSICPDFQIQYGCRCPSTTPIHSGGGAVAIGGAGGNGSGLRGGGSGGGGTTSGINSSTSGTGHKSGNSGSGTGSGTGQSSGSGTGSGTGKSNGSGNGFQKICVNYFLLFICTILELCRVFAI
ncbi:cysteine proteinase 4-like [Ruditapes philippinarum]|uniref:cysteine proteinase 4-like n=1 Tax=Ruditapes philippinarum TaxID=129788 RepID=UPI00295AAF0D|nr:cysteine proteinase 4-like [Ruditapes philippinarum]